MDEGDGSGGYSPSGLDGPHRVPTGARSPHGPEFERRTVIKHHGPGYVRLEFERSAALFGFKTEYSGPTTSHVKIVFGKEDFWIQVYRVPAPNSGIHGQTVRLQVFSHTLAGDQAGVFDTHLHAKIEILYPVPMHPEYLALRRKVELVLGEFAKRLNRLPAPQPRPQNPNRLSWRLPRPERPNPGRS